MPSAGRGFSVGPDAISMGLVLKAWAAKCGSETVTSSVSGPRHSSSCHPAARSASFAQGETPKCHLKKDKALTGKDLAV